MILTCVDTCCILNSTKADFFGIIAVGLNRIFYIQGIVEDELNEVDDFGLELIQAGLLHSISGSTVFASEVGDVAANYNLGLGEAECIAIAKKNGFTVASDDGNARKAAAKELGREKIIGSLGLVVETVKSGIIDPSTAASGYDAMRRRGAFLPPVPNTYFTKV